jgi:tRNA pseudouridine38-40 synthase
VEYDGGSYSGSQAKIIRPTVQCQIEAALLSLTGEKIRINLASRTDAGTHAGGQVVSFSTSCGLEIRAFVHGLNHYLPSDIAIKSAHQVDIDFDPRRRAARREYLYRILNVDTRSPLWRGRAYQVAGKLDEKLMEAACQLLVGEHDFASFTSPSEAGKSTRRRVYRAGIQREGDMLTFTVTANAFLPHQVRYIVGTLIRVGQSRLTVEEFGNILKACQAALAGPVVPACGLYLNRIEYSNYLKEVTDENL